MNRKLAYRPRVEILEGRDLLSTVTSLADSGTGSLREALAITPSGGRVDFAPGLIGVISLTSQELTIDKDVTVSGPGAHLLTVSGQGLHRVFVVTANPTISGLTIADGNAANNNVGGAIKNAGTLVITNCILSNNKAGRGGAIFNTGYLFIRYSALINNTAESGPIAGGTGGAIFNTNVTNVEDSTFSGNKAQGTGSLPGSGGAITNEAAAFVATRSTIAGNEVTGNGQGGGISSGADSPLTLQISIVAGNSAPLGPDIAGAVSSADHSLVGNSNGSTGLVNGQNGNQIGTPDNPIDPGLGPLGNNGGPTPTMALLDNSPAIGAGPPIISADDTDQRGYFRAVPRLDIGAFAHGVVTGPFFGVGGKPGRMVVLRNWNGSQLASFLPFGSSYSGGLAFVPEDLNRDGYPEMIVAPTDGNPHVKIYSGAAIARGTFDNANPDASLLTSFIAYGLNFNVGANLATADLNGDAFPDIVTGATRGNPHVKVYSGKAIAEGTFDSNNPDGSLINQFFAYGLDFNVGVNVAATIVLRVSSFGRRLPDIRILITGPTAGNPHVKIFRVSDGSAVLFREFFAYDLNFNVGVNLAINQNIDIIDSSEPGLATGATTGNPHVKVYSKSLLTADDFDSNNPDGRLLTQFFADDFGFNSGASVAVADFERVGINNGVNTNILTGTQTIASRYRVFRKDANGVKPAAFFEGTVAEIEGDVRVGA